MLVSSIQIWVKWTEVDLQPLETVDSDYPPVKLSSSLLQLISVHFSQLEQVESLIIRISSPHFTTLMEREVFCVELMFDHWSICFITACASVNTVQKDRTGGLPGNGPIDWGIASREGYMFLNPLETDNIGKMLPKEGVRNPTGGVCLWHAAFCPQWYISLTGHFPEVKVWR